MRRLDPSLGASLREELQPLVAIAPDHQYSVYAHYTTSKKNLAQAMLAQVSG